MILALTQARISSTRLPQKVLKKLGSTSVLELHLSRIKKSKLINKVVLATTQEPGVESLLTIAENCGVNSFQGNLNDVLDRFYQAAKFHQAKIVVRLTSDCPLIDANLVDQLIERFLASGADYASNCLNPTYPDGFDAEVFTFKALEKAWLEARLTSEREHVTPFIWGNSDLKGGKLFRAFSLENNVNLSQFRLTLDNQEDYELLQTLVDKLGTNQDWKTYTQYLIDHPEVFKMNNHLKRNSGYDQSLKEDKK